MSSKAPKPRGGGSEGRIKTERAGGLFLIGIDRPEKLNGFSPKMMRELAEAYQAYEDDDACRCAVLYAEGPHFTAGADLSLVDLDVDIFPESLTDPANLRGRLRNKPLVVAVTGVCYTLGIELMLAADIVIAASDCRFGQIEVARGIVPFEGATFRMIASAGWGNAMRYLLTAEEFDAETALRFGFVQEIVEPGRARDRAIELAERIARQAPLAVRATIASGRSFVREGLPAAEAELPALVARLRETEDFAEGMRSFKERRDGEYVGR
jgi:enoyl-CoA hydratase/carnithine racemase